jgi:hypothetical protein
VKDEERAAINRRLAERFEPEPKFTNNGFPVRESLCWIGAFDANDLLLRKDPQDFFQRPILNEMVLKCLPAFASHVVIQFARNGGFALDMNFLDKQTKRYEALQLEEAIVMAYVDGLDEIQERKATANV